MLTLYYKPTCPYCQRVLAKAEDLHIHLDLKNISNDDVLTQELIDHGGKRQVPYLIDTTRDNALYESNDIMAYLEAHGTSSTPETHNGLRIHTSPDSCDVCE